MSGGPPPSGPAQPLAPGNFDKAWNDPPLFSYSVSSTPQAGGSRLLNKRVGFPSSHPPPPGQDPTAPPKLHDAGAKPPSSCLPPPPPAAHGNVPLPSSSVSESVDQSATISIDDTKAIYEELMKTYLSPEKYKTISAKLSVMFKAWQDGALNPRLQALVAEVGSKLTSKDQAGAEASYVVLSADYGGEIGAQWVLAIRHIITAVSEELREAGQEAGVTKPL